MDYNANNHLVLQSLNYVLSNYQYNNIISIGDSINEYTALIDLYKNNKEIRYFKNIKLFKHPNNDLLNEELKLLKNNYFDIFRLQENKDLIIKINKQIFL